MLRRALIRLLLWAAVLSCITQGFAANLEAPRGAIYGQAHQATRIPLAIDWEYEDLEKAFWITPRRAIVISNTKYGYRHTRAFTVDRDAGSESDLKSLNEALEAHDISAILDYDPGTKRFLGWQLPGSYVEVREDGTIGRSWKSSFFQAARWLPGARSWVECPKKTNEGFLNIGDREGSGHRSVALSEAIGSWLVGYRSESVAYFCSSLVSRKATPMVQLFTVHLDNGGKVTRTALLVPDELNLERLHVTPLDIVASPRCDRLAWLIERGVGDEERPGVGGLPGEGRQFSGIQREIWVTSFQGQGAKRIFTDEPIVDTGRKPSDMVDHLHWLPDGEGLAFTLRRALCVVRPN